MSKLLNMIGVPMMALALPLAGCHRASAPLIETGTAEGIAPGDWPSFGRDGSEQHFSPLDEISTDNVDQIGLAWHYDLEPSHTVSSPVEGDGKLFITTGHSHIRAFDAPTGRLLWDYDAHVADVAPDAIHNGWGNKGIAYWNRRVFLETTDGRVIALDGSTGRPIWEQRDYPLNELRTASGPPRVFGGKVIIGHGGADISPIRGYVSAYDAMTGRLLWRFHTIPGDPRRPPENRAMQIAAPTWRGDWYGHGGGGTAWNAFSHDPALNMIYLGVGNGFPYNQALRSPGGGDNLFLASIVAVDATTGEYRWHYQVCPAEQWDCTATMDMTLATLNIGGQPTPVLMQAPKNGFFYVIDRRNGHLISAAQHAQHVTWASRIDLGTGRPVENPGIRYQGRGMFELWPGPTGAHSWLPQAYSPQTGLVYIPAIENGAMIGPVQPGMSSAGPGAGNGVTMIPDPDLPGGHRSFLRAWDPVRRRVAWQVQLPGMWPGGVLATNGGLVFEGRLDGLLVAYDARTGRQLWSFRAQAPIVAPPISYRVGGRQYITVLTGNGNSGGGIMSNANANIRTDYTLPRHVLTFALGGHDRLPAYTPPSLVAAPDPDFRPDPARIGAGAMAFATNGCIVCHGLNAIGGGAAPDLRYSGVIVNQQAFRHIVHDGALAANGMPIFPQIPDDRLEAIRLYVRARAHGLAGPPPATGRSAAGGARQPGSASPSHVKITG